MQTRLVDLAPRHRFMKFDRIDWNRAFFKTYYEKRSFGHLLVNFNRIWVIHISLYWFYTAFNSPKVYQITLPNNKVYNSPALSWSVTALGGTVATIIMIAATLAEFSYIPTTWNNSSHLSRRLLFLFITLALTCGPTFYIAIAESSSNGTTSSLSLILGIVQFFISVVATLLFATMPSGRMFGGQSRRQVKEIPCQSDFHRFISCAAYGTAPGLYRTLGSRLWLQSHRILFLPHAFVPGSHCCDGGDEDPELWREVLRY